MSAKAARFLITAAALAGGGSALALDSVQWPPPAEVESRMRGLQAVIRDPSSTRAQREAARTELSALLKSPAGQARGPTPDEKPPRPARAAIEPYPSVVRPLPSAREAVPAPPGVARVEVVEPPRAPVVVPQSGAPLAPSGRFAVDPRTGSVLHEVPGGYVDPRTGQFVPR